MPANGWLTLGDGSTSSTISTPAGAPDTSPTSSPLAGAGDAATPLETPAASTVYIQPSPPPSVAAKPEPTIAGSRSIDLEGGTQTAPPPTPTIVTINGKISTETPIEPAAATEETPTPIVTVINGKTTTITPVPSLVAASGSLANGYVEGLISSANPTAANGIPTVVTLVAGGKSYTETLIYQSSSLSGYIPAGGYVLLSINASDVFEIFNLMPVGRLFLCLELMNSDI